jgi:hypothetical protein
LPRRQIHGLRWLTPIFQCQQKYCEFYLHKDF